MIQLLWQLFFLATPSSNIKTMQRKKKTCQTFNTKPSAGENNSSHNRFNSSSLSVRGCERLLDDLVPCPQFSVNVIFRDRFQRHLCDLYSWTAKTSTQCTVWEPTQSPLQLIPAPTLQSTQSKLYCGGLVHLHLANVKSSTCSNSLLLFKSFWYQEKESVMMENPEMFSFSEPLPWLCSALL